MDLISLILYIALILFSLRFCKDKEGVLIVWFVAMMLSLALTFCIGPGIYPIITFLAVFLSIYPFLFLLTEKDPSPIRS